VYCNEAVVRLLDYTPQQLDEAAPDGYQGIIAGTQTYDQTAEDILRSFQRGESWRGSLKLRRKDGDQFDAALTVTQVSGSGSQPPGVVTVFRDISQEKALQAQKDRFIANASHELRTPLANIKTRLYLIRRQPDRVNLHLDVMDRVTESMAELIENLLDISRFERGVIRLYRREVVLQDVIGGVVAIQQAEAERKGIILRADLPARPLTVSADAQRLAQVITNLVTNAINYTPETGQITVELDWREGDGRQCVVLRVRDTGIGIAPEQVRHVFEPFFRANEGMASGTGLGLTIAREIVHLHNGQIAVESEVGRGSVFTVTLDLAEGEPGSQ
jgi:two-component system phosphate regulon sensor histidine kinase PhoR